MKLNNKDNTIYSDEILIKILIGVKEKYVNILIIKKKESLRIEYEIEKSNRDKQ